MKKTLVALLVLAVLATGIGVTTVLGAVATLYLVNQDPPTTPIATSDGHVSADAPLGWDCTTNQQAGVSMAKCRAPADEFFFLIAKEYTVPPSAVRSADELVDAIYLPQYETMFSRVKVLSRERVASDACEVVMELWHTERGRILKRERVSVEGTRVHVVSSEGAADSYLRRYDETVQWFDSARFTSS